MYLHLVDCVWGPWIPSPCSTSCGNGTQTLTRSMIRNATYGGKPCDGLTEKIIKCDQKECPGKFDEFEYYFICVFDTSSI